MSTTFFQYFIGGAADGQPIPESICKANPLPAAISHLGAPSTDYRLCVVHFSGDEQYYYRAPDVTIEDAEEKVAQYRQQL